MYPYAKANKAVFFQSTGLHTAYLLGMQAAYQIHTYNKSITQLATILNILLAHTELQAVYNR